MIEMPLELVGEMLLLFGAMATQPLPPVARPPAGSIVGQPPRPVPASVTLQVTSPSLVDRIGRYVNEMLSSDTPKPHTAVSQGDYLTVAGTTANTVAVVEISDKPLVLPIASPYPKTVRIIGDDASGANQEVKLGAGSGEAVFAGARAHAGMIRVDVIEQITEGYSETTTIMVQLVKAIDTPMLPDLISPGDDGDARVLKKALLLSVGPTSPGIGSIPPRRNPWSLAAYDILYDVARNATRPEARETANRLLAWLGEGRLSGLADFQD